MMKHMPLVDVPGCLYHATASRLHMHLSLTKSFHVVPKFWIIIWFIGILYTYTHVYIHTYI